MGSEVYEWLAMAARYWFVALAAFIALRAWRASVTDNRNAKVLRDWTPQTGCIGELLVTADEADTELTGERIPVPREGMLGSSRAADVRIPHPDVRPSHLWLDQRVGCMLLSPIKGAELDVPGFAGAPYVVQDGQMFRIGRLSLMMVFFDVDGNPGDLLDEDVSGP